MKPNDWFESVEKLKISFGIFIMIYLYNQKCCMIIIDMISSVYGGLWFNIVPMWISYVGWVNNHLNSLIGLVDWIGFDFS